MAESAVSFLFNQLSLWLQQEQNLLRGLEQEAEYIRDEFGNMRAFLRVADAKEENDPQLKEWVKKVHEITCDTEDVLEEYLHRFSYPHYGANGFSRPIKRICTFLMSLKARHQIASEIQTIKSRVENVSRSQQRFREMYAMVNQVSSSTPASHEWSCDDNRGDALLLEEADVVGIEKPKQQLLDWLLSANDGLKVISVVGMGGLGKTTMVKRVYDDTSVKANFDCHAWVTVSASFKTEHLLRDIIKRLHLEGKQQPPQELEAMTVDDMKEFVSQFLQRKTYIIVLDDVWKINAWESVRYAFPRSNNRGCIVITTRFSSIGNAACSETNGHLYDLEPLNDEESEKLFNKKAFQQNSCPLYLKEISQSILNRCEGLPLAIVVIGGLLATKNNIYEEWKMFERNIGLELEGDNLKRMTKIIGSLSYYDLPYYLKSCFSYLSIFPEDALLQKWRIIRLWVAEGFVEAKQGKTEEEVAEGYLNELLNRSLIQVAGTYVDGRPKMFRIHDILREYIISKSREHSVLSITSGEEVRWPDNIRRMAIHTTFNDTKESYNVKCLRSLLWLEWLDSESVLILSKILVGGCRLLKVLDVRGSHFNSIPNEIFKLYHLKYLSLRRTYIKIIPKSIENLQNLETLDLKKSKVTELPIEILKLRKLRHLLVYSYRDFHYSSLSEDIQSFKAPYEIGRYLPSLQKLCYIDAEEVNGCKTVREIGKLTQLRRLGITKLRREDGKDLCFSLAKLFNLHSLVVNSIKEGEVMDLDHSLVSPSPLPVLRKLVLRGCLEKVPQWVHSLNGLTELHLRWSRLIDVPLQHLGVLPNLVCLNLFDFAYEGEELSFNNRGFQSLKKLRLKSLRGLRWIRVEQGSIPHLEQLYLSNCKLMVELPNGIEHLKHLERVAFIDMSEEFVRGLSLKKRRGEEWKLARVPKVDVYNFENDKWEQVEI